MTILLMSLSACASDVPLSSRPTGSVVVSSTANQATTYPTFPSQQFSETIDFVRQEGGADVHTIVGDRYPEMIVWFQFGVPSERIVDLMASYSAKFADVEWSYRELVVSSEELYRRAGEVAQQFGAAVSFDYRSSRYVLNFSSATPQANRDVSGVELPYPLEIGPDLDIRLDDTTATADAGP